MAAPELALESAPADTPLDIEVRLFGEALRQRYGYDFSGYADASFKRRVLRAQLRARLPSVSALTHAVLHDTAAFADVLQDLTVTTSELFRDPLFFRALREQVVPVLSTYPALKVWVAGCSTGEEVVSLAILLKEVGLYDRAVIYATDINAGALRTARTGIYPLDVMQAATAAYQASGGTQAFSRYYSAAYDAVCFDRALRDNVVFFDHNLVTDDVFAEVHLVLCRNVMIYFKRDLQARVVDLFARSLRYKGFLALGSKESVRFLPSGESFGEVDADQRIYRLVRQTGAAPMARNNGGAP